MAWGKPWEIKDTAFILIAEVPRGNILLQDWHLYCERRGITRQYDKATRCDLRASGRYSDIPAYRHGTASQTLSYSQVNSNPKEEI